MAARVTAVAGDVASDGLGPRRRRPRPLSDCDIVIHSAATVSFDSPLDAAVEVNLLGPSRVAEAIVDRPGAGRAEGRTGPATSSRCPPPTWPAPTRARPPRSCWTTTRSPWTSTGGPRSRRPGASGATPTPSRQPERLAAFRKAARERARRGRPPPAGRAGRAAARGLGQEPDGRVGQARAQSLGWPDAYAYTKALGERALVAQFGDTVPITIVRPSIIESALAEPRPGWIRGFRMAEPVIISYARGLLKRVPGVPEGIIDVIPVDLVVARHHRGGRRGAPRRADAAATPGPTRVPGGLRGRGTRCATAGWSTWCRTGSSSTRSTTATASPSWCPSGRSRAGAGCSGS